MFSSADGTGVRFDIRYRTRFEYDAPVRESQNELRACPVTDHHQRLIAYRVVTTPPTRVFTYTDACGTRVDAFGIRAEHRSLQVVVEAAVETTPAPLLATAPTMAEVTESEFADAHYDELQPSPHTRWDEGVRRHVDELQQTVGDDPVGLVLAIHRRVGHLIDYQPGATYVGVPVEDVLGNGVGVCQDYAHLAIAMCRAARIPARYVSGYFFSGDDRSGDDTDEDVIHVQTHAWFEAAIPHSGWLALDPTNRRPVGERHITIGRGRDYNDVPPLKGVYSGSASPTLAVDVELRRSQSQRQSQK